MVITPNETGWFRRVALAFFIAVDAIMVEDETTTHSHRAVELNILVLYLWAGIGGWNSRDRVQEREATIGFDRNSVGDGSGSAHTLVLAGLFGGRL